jgi:hypothetical protein
LTDGHSPHAIAKAIHKKAINDERYSGECVGQGENYIKIYAVVSGYKSRLKGGEKNDKVEEDDAEDLDSAPNDEKLKDLDDDFEHGFT